VNSRHLQQRYFFSAPEIPPSASEKIRTNAFLTSGSRSSRPSDSSRARVRSIVASPPAVMSSAAEKRSRRRYDRMTPSRFSRISVWRTAPCSLTWPRSASTEVHRVAKPSLSASDWRSSRVFKSTRQMRKSGSDGRIIDIATSPIAEYLNQHLFVWGITPVADSCLGSIRAHHICETSHVGGNSQWIIRRLSLMPGFIG
jgi:hypothetical protein